MTVRSVVNCKTSSLVYVVRFKQNHKIVFDLDELSYRICRFKYPRPVWVGLTTHRSFAARRNCVIDKELTID